MRRRFTSSLEDERERIRDEKGSVSVKLIGEFHGYDGKLIELKIKGERPLRSIIDLLTDILGSDIGSVGSSFVVLINGVESSVLNGLKAKVEPGDELVLLRISHGG